MKRKIMYDPSTKLYYLCEKQMIFIGKLIWVIIEKSKHKKDLEE